MSRRVLKWTIPVDDRDHPIGGGRVAHVACQSDANTVQVWTDEPDAEQVEIRSARVYGTGQPIPKGDEHLGSTITEDGFLVWHVFASSRETTLREVPC